jgi:hypothetical protein
LVRILSDTSWNRCFVASPMRANTRKTSYGVEEIHLCARNTVPSFGTSYFHCANGWARTVTKSPAFARGAIF